MAAAIKLSTMGRPSIISITMMNDVSGACVAAARKDIDPVQAHAGTVAGIENPGLQPLAAGPVGQKRLCPFRSGPEPDLGVHQRDCVGAAVRNDQALARCA